MKAPVCHVYSTEGGYGKEIKSGSHFINGDIDAFSAYQTAENSDNRQGRQRSYFNKAFIGHEIPDTVAGD